MCTQELLDLVYEKFQARGYSANDVLHLNRDRIDDIVTLTLIEENIEYRDKDEVIDELLDYLSG